ncbi:hypothetical protein LIER_12736 [Lithospermum erythrorhizon]|uniref:Reverse transcriptase domain-containing protein n=1 Tax=Lithospermum erythrorhizon TaxID=34254 RepID=A0AAV3PUS3_LITER
MDKGVFILQLASDEVKHLILEKIPCSFSRRPLILRAWDVGMSSEVDALPIWIQFPNLPLDLCTAEALSILASRVGVPLFADRMNSEQSRLGYARVCVEVRVEDELFDEITVRYSLGQEYVQKVTYEWVPSKCSRYKKFGHNGATCKAHQEYRPVFRGESSRGRGTGKEKVTGFGVVDGVEDVAGRFVGVRMVREVQISAAGLQQPGGVLIAVEQSALLSPSVGSLSGLLQPDGALFSHCGGEGLPYHACTQVHVLASMEQHILMDVQVSGGSDFLFSVVYGASLYVQRRHILPMSLVEEAWQSVELDGSPLDGLLRKCNFTKVGLSRLNKDHFFDIVRRVRDCSARLQEFVQGYYKEDGIPKAAIKVDLLKAYDMVEWENLCVGMLAMGFPHRFIFMLKCCITKASFSINLNSTLKCRFASWLRKGDLISSYLFILVLEIFNGLMRRASDSSAVRFHPKCQQLCITHLSFADDMVLLVSADMDSFRVIKETLVLFGDLTGLKLNCSKSRIFFWSTPRNVRSALCEYTEMSEGVLPVQYLGIPLSSKSLSKADYSGLNSWCVNLPFLKYVVEEVEKRVRCFLWNGKDEGPYRAKVAWIAACLPLVEGGLGFKGMVVWNQDGRSVSFWFDNWSFLGPIWYVLIVQERFSIQLPRGISLRDALPLKLLGVRRQSSMVLRYGIPRHDFITWMLFHLKLGRVWRLVLQKLKAYRGGLGIWQARGEERNSRVFGGTPVSVDLIYHRVVSIVHDRSCSWRGVKRNKANWEISLEWSLSHSIFSPSY